MSINQLAGIDGHAAARTRKTLGRALDGHVKRFFNGTLPIGKKLTSVLICK